MADRGCFIVLEGGEGAGKSTQAALLSRWMDERGIAHVRTREPGGTGVGEAIRSLVLERTDLEIPPRSELFLLLAARAAFVREVVRPALADGKVVLADRFALSTLAYQGYGRGLPLPEVEEANRLATEGLEPDLYLVLDVTVADGVRRQRRDRKEADRMEGSGQRFLERVRRGYLALAEVRADVRVLPGLGTPDEVHGRICELLAAELPETFSDGSV